MRSGYRSGRRIWRNGTPATGAGQAIEVDRKVQRDGHVLIAGGKCQVGFGLAGSTVVMP